VQRFDGYDSKGKQVARRFYMDIVSSTNVTVTSVQGVAEFDDSDHVFYKFLHSISASFDSIGSNKVAFRFQASDGSSMPLANLDQDTGELFDDSTRALGFAVKSELRLADIVGPQLPAGQKLAYGQTVAISFRVKDAVTGKAVASNGEASAYLVLRHRDGKSGQLQVSTRIQAEAATDETGKYALRWLVNPNAEKGKGTLELVAQGADGKDIVLVDDKGQPWRVDVDVGGEFEVEESSYSKAVVDPRSSDEYALMFIGFRLSSGGKPLTGAQMVARVLKPDGSEAAVVPVTEGVTTDGENFGYQASWSLGTDEAPAGIYSVEFYREADRRRFGQAESFFSLKVKYDGASTSWLPVRTEFIVIVLLSIAFGFAALRKADLSGKKK